MLRADLVGPGGDHLKLRDRAGGTSPGSDPAIAPGLFGDPFERVETIRPIEIEREILAFRGKSTATILRHQNEAAFDRFGADSIQAVFIVGGASKNHRQRV